MKLKPGTPVVVNPLQGITPTEIHILPVENGFVVSVDHRRPHKSLGSVLESKEFVFGQSHQERSNMMGLLSSASAAMFENKEATSHA